MLDIRLDALCKTYAGGIPALEGVSLSVAAGQCLALVGPSGCGKTTLLRVVAGLEEATSGSVRLGERVVNRVPPHRRDVAMVFQRPALIPGRSVRENLAWSWTLQQRGVGQLLRTLVGRPRRTATQERDLDEVAGLLGIGDLLGRPAGQLSGGQQQRVALGRALLRRAPVCLLDEPLGHLEAALRTQLRRDLRLLSRRFPATMVHVTHDPAEALAVGDQVAVLHQGRLQQAGSPVNVLRRPANRWVAAFCHPQAPLSFVDGSLQGAGSDLAFVVGTWLRLAVPDAVRKVLHGLSEVTLGIDARDVKILPGDAVQAPGAHIMPVDVMLTEFAPQGQWVTCRRDAVQLTGLHTASSAAAIGPRVMLTISLDNAFWFETATGRTLWAPTG